jgi:hypothetical protein
MEVVNLGASPHKIKVGYQFADQRLETDKTCRKQASVRHLANQQMDKGQ